MRKLTCHCGAIEIEINLKDGLTNLKRCNCSMCKRKGAILKNINKEDLKIIKGEDKLNSYQFLKNYEYPQIEFNKISKKVNNPTINNKFLIERIKSLFNYC